jgi:gluconate kinase
MIDGLKNEMFAKDPTETDMTDESLESIAIAGASAIQRLIADRDHLRNYVTTQQRDLIALTATNEELRRRIASIRHHYIELGTRILTQLEQFDQATRDLMRDKQPDPVTVRDEDANLVSLAQRLKPSKQQEGENFGERQF